MKIDTTVNELSDMLTTIIEGGIIMSRTLSEQKIFSATNIVVSKLSQA